MEQADGRRERATNGTIGQYDTTDESRGEGSRGEEMRGEDRRGEEQVE